MGSDGESGELQSQTVDFNPRSPCGERPQSSGIFLPIPRISIHAPRVGSDFDPQAKTRARAKFQSTLPVWGATGRTFNNSCVRNFNPRSPCGERPWTHDRIPEHWDFNPRSPCGERRPPAPACSSPGIFQSTLPVWGATVAQQLMDLVRAISIHAPRVGSDPKDWTERWGQEISIHAPRVGSDGGTSTCTWRSPNFNPRSPCGERHRR